MMKAITKAFKTKGVTKMVRPKTNTVLYNPYR
jgi:hypothetical protein